MESAEDLIAKGRACLGSARRLHQYFTQSPAAAPSCEREPSPGVEEAKNHLSSLRNDGSELKELADRIRGEQQALQTALLQELTALGESTHRPDSALTKLNRRRYQEESKLLKLQRNLATGESKVRAARDSLLRAKSESSTQTDTAATAVSTSGAMAGAVVGFGLVELVRLVMGSSRAATPPSRDSVQRAEHDLSVRQKEVKRLEQKVDLAEKSLRSVERDILGHFEAISTEDSAKSNLLSKISATKNIITFQSEAVEFWELFVRAASSSEGTEHAQCLERLVDWAREVRKVKVLRSSGYSVEEMSFAEAWEEVTFQHGLILQE